LTHTTNPGVIAKSPISVNVYRGGNAAKQPIQSGHLKASSQKVDAFLSITINEKNAWFSQCAEARDNQPVVGAVQG